MESHMRRIIKAPYGPNRSQARPNVLCHAKTSGEVLCSSRVPEISLFEERFLLNGP